MKKRTLAIALVAIVLIVAVLAAMSMAARKAPAKTPPAKPVVSAVCPVMGGTIPDVTKAAASSVYNGKTYYFCCPGCKPKFDANPEKYINKK